MSFGEKWREYLSWVGSILLILVELAIFYWMGYGFYHNWSQWKYLIIPELIIVSGILIIQSKTKKFMNKSEQTGVLLVFFGAISALWGAYVQWCRTFHFLKYVSADTNDRTVLLRHILPPHEFGVWRFLLYEHNLFINGGFILLMIGVALMVAGAAAKNRERDDETKHWREKMESLILQITAPAANGNAKTEEGDESNNRYDSIDKPNDANI